MSAPPLHQSFTPYFSSQNNLVASAYARNNTGIQSLFNNIAPSEALNITAPIAKEQSRPLNIIPDDNQDRTKNMVTQASVPVADESSWKENQIFKQESSFPYNPFRRQRRDSWNFDNMDIVLRKDLKRQIHNRLHLLE